VDGSTDSTWLPKGLAGFPRCTGSTDTPLSRLPLSPLRRLRKPRIAPVLPCSGTVHSRSDSSGTRRSAPPLPKHRTGPWPVHRVNPGRNLCSLDGASSSAAVKLRSGAAGRILVPPSRCCSALGVCSGSGVQVCCNLLPAMGFIAFSILSGDVAIPFCSGGFRSPLAFLVRPIARVIQARERRRPRDAMPFEAFPRRQPCRVRPDA